MTKIIAYYLPQYYETDYNNEWWGKGFTEWTHIRAAKPLYTDHNQPRVPLNENYYNLLNKETVQWQTNLAEEFGIYGFAYYHYWFNGKLLLEKPAENLLGWKDINQRFFFFWANHTWYKANNGKKKILMEQVDGGEKDWIAHYRYMVDFFRDKRYIKIDNKPVVGIYSMDMLNNPDEMIEIWNQLAIKDGFNGVYVIENRTKKSNRKYAAKSNAVVCRQPLVAMNEFNLKFYKRVIRKIKKILFPIPNRPQMIPYKIISELEKKYEPHIKEKEFLGCSVGWDNTPRHKNFGQVFTNASPSCFQETLESLLVKSEKNNNEFLFINAWNEWAEGMYLEPDITSQYEYLAAIKDAINRTRDRNDNR